MIDMIKNLTEINVATFVFISITLKQCAYRGTKVLNCFNIAKTSLNGSIRGKTVGTLFVNCRMDDNTAIL